MKSKDCTSFIKSILTVGCDDRYKYYLSVGNPNILGNSCEITTPYSYKDKSKCRQASRRMANRLGLTIVSEV